jgi:putative ABC transport system substrate-binding protein
MNRREFVAVLGGAMFAGPLRAQQSKMPKIGVLTLLGNAEPFYGLFRDALRDIGLVPGKTIQLELRTSAGQPKLLAQHAAELVSRRFDIIATIQTPAALAAKQATADIPIVLVVAGDPVATGLVATLARPGGNVTGMSGSGPEAAVKSLELMREIVPSLRRVGALIDATDAFSKPFLEQIQLAARRLSMQIQAVVIRANNEIDAALAAMTKEKAGAVIVQPSLPLDVIELALNHRLPAIAPNSRYAAAGCVMTYSQDVADSCRKAANYVDRILKGAKPAELPVEQPTKFELVINQKSARALGLTVPQSVLLRADRVIE